MKICRKCHEEKPLNEFPFRKDKTDGYHIYCKCCVRNQHIKYDTDHEEERKISKRTYYNNNKDKILAQMKSVRLPGSRKEYLKQYYIKNKEKSKQNTKEYRKHNKDKINAWCREYYKDPSKRIARSMYNRVRIAIFTQLAEKNQKTELLCGCTWDELVVHLEKLFKPGMTWENYGRWDGYWSIDHVIPCSKFDLTDPIQQAQCFHYTNLQPLWTHENSAKRNF
jgi:hypothetical protein